MLVLQNPGAVAPIELAQFNFVPLLRRRLKIHLKAGGRLSSRKPSHSSRAGSLINFE